MRGVDTIVKYGRTDKGVASIDFYNLESRDLSPSPHVTLGFM
jgi:hypothetical protein